jgi:predicted aspartyl protease
MRSTTVIAVPLLCVLAIACGRVSASADAVPAGAPAGLEWPEVLRLQRARDYFTLRDRLATAQRGGTPARYARALVEHAFNDPAASNATAAALLAEGVLPDSLATELRQVQIANHLRLSAYAAGLAATDTVLTHASRLEAGTRRELLNAQRIFRTLAAVPSQTAVTRGPAALRLDAGRVPVQVNDSSRRYILDTGANLSTMMRSEARTLGLPVHRAGIEMGTSTDRRVTADLAVVDRLTVGHTEFRHVVFLVVEDSLLTFPDGFRIPGLLGFPVIAQLGEVQFGRGGELTIPAPTPRRTAGNLALSGLTPLTRARWVDAGGARSARGRTAVAAPLVCRLDTGADRTQFYEPFYRRYRPRLDAITTATTRRTGGVGGYRELPTRVLRPARLALGDTAVTLDSADVLTSPIVRNASENFLDCNIGRDVLDAFSRYVVNFRDMAVLLQ